MEERIRRIGKERIIGKEEGKETGREGDRGEGKRVPTYAVSFTLCHPC
jgi:hypothetical protein